MNYEAAKSFILHKLETELSDRLSYHGIHHTLDVLSITEELCSSEKISPYNTTLLKTAALLHDSGFCINNKEHEQLSCGIARESLPDFDYSELEIEKICGMIMATKIPQSPQNYLEEIICDADLDYLGRNDFKFIGASLFEELKAFDIVGDTESWNRIQVNFISAHRFFTNTNKEKREHKKQEHLSELKKIVATYK